jgi:thiol-disulfide isomerase/thioredoxin
LEFPVPESLRLIVLLLIGLLASSCDRQKDAAPQAPAAAADSGKGVDRSHRGQAAPATRFTDPAGKPVTLAGFRGRAVLVNLWASWCAPCVKELPTLQALEAAKAKAGTLRVIAVSQDNGPQGSVDAFLASKKLGRFAAYHDPEMALSGAFGVQILPSTILYDAAGKEVWRFTGDMDWTGAEATALLAEAG